MAKFKKVSADEAHALRKDHTRDVGGKSAIIKASRTMKAPRSWDSESRTCGFVMTSEHVDRYKDVVMQAGMDTEMFLENPTALAFHNSRSWPIGTWSDVEKNLTGRPRRTSGVLNFLAEGVEEDADRAARHVAAGSMRAVSIGFVPDWNEIDMILDDEEHWTGGLRFNKSELIECSLVPVPANPHALAKDLGGSDWALAKETIEQVLDNWSRSPTGVLMPRSQFEAAYRGLVLPATFTGGSISAETKALIRNAAEVLSNEEAAEIELDAEDIAVEEGDGGTEFKKDVVDETVSEPIEDVTAEGLREFLTGAKSVRLELDCFETEPVNGYRHFEKVAGTALIKVNWRAGEVGEVLEDVRELQVLEWTEELAAVYAELEPGINAQEEGARDDKTKTLGTIEVGLDVDTASLDKATEKVTALGALVDSVSEKLKKFFGAHRGAADPAPIIEPPAPPAPPTQEEMNAAREKALAVRQRLIAKGLIEA